MRLILTFRPATSFLVPLDKCLRFSLDALGENSKGMNPELRLCLQDYIHNLQPAGEIICTEFYVTVCSCVTFTGH